MLALVTIDPASLKMDVAVTVETISEAVGTLSFSVFGVESSVVVLGSSEEVVVMEDSVIESVLSVAETSAVNPPVTPAVDSTVFSSVVAVEWVSVLVGTNRLVVVSVVALLALVLAVVSGIAVV